MAQWKLIPLLLFAVHWLHACAIPYLLLSSTSHVFHIYPPTVSYSLLSSPAIPFYPILPCPSLLSYSTTPHHFQRPCMLCSLSAVVS